MSWDAHLTDDRDHRLGDWNYTHNCNAMIESALEGCATETRKPWWSQFADEHGGFTGDPDVPHIGRYSWWDLLDGKNGPEGAALLNRIIGALEADPGRFRAMNPENGWGDYDGLLKVLIDMHNAVPEWPSTWSISG